ncbi:MAG: zinc ribbon domain-containing protein [Actinobacteria bacterium]|nr:zinc ribbon domain-containing protein [Actinomycetota bacterium]OPZ75544.1 MAG: Zinc ribbon domain protein [Actinobacteria bacterium ADurb.Bin444]
MPTYEYRCTSCNHQFERFQKMSDEPVAECELCGAQVRRILFPVPIHFKGSGFYTTDYGRKSGRARKPASACGTGGTPCAAGDNECGSAGKESCCAACND